MAVTETVKIVFDVDNKAITDTVTDLAQLGKVSQEDAAKFKQLSDASKTASKDLAAVGKSAEGIKNIAASSKSAADGFIPLKTRLKEAKEELQRLSDEFGEFSPQANEARAKAGELADGMSDLNRQVNLLNPESKIQAFSAFGQGVVGAFSIATGALQAFGAENEQVKAIAEKLQGALNVTQGIQSLIQLKEAYSDIQAVIGFTSTAQETLTETTQAFGVVSETVGAIQEGVAEVQGVATSIQEGYAQAQELGAIASEAAALGQKGLELATNASTTAAGGATRAFNALKVALVSNPFTAIAVAIGALAAAYYALTPATEDPINATDELKASQDNLQKTTDALVESELKLAIAQGKMTQSQADKIKQRTEESNQIKPLIDKQKKLNDEIQKQEKYIKSLREAGLSEDTWFDDQVELAVENLNKLKLAAQTNEQDIKNIRKTGRNERKIIDDKENKEKQDQQDKEKEDAARNAKELSEAQKQALRQRIEDAKNAFEEERKAREDSLDLNRLMGATEEDILRQKQFNIQADIDGLQKVADLAKGTEQYKQLLNQINDLKREQVKIDVQLQNALQIEKAPEGFKKLEEAIKKVNKAIQDLQPVKVSVDPVSFQDIIDKEEALKKKRFETAQFTIDKAGELTDFLIAEGNRETEERIARLDEQREAGLISEEAYQAGLKKIKQKNAEDNKKFQVFLALLQSAQAILTALQTPPNPLDPTAQIRAVTFASVTAAINLAKILATPVPKFKEGTLSVPGQDHGRDSVYAMLRPGEAVIPTETNRMYAPTIEAIYRKRIKPSEINAFVLNRMSGKGSIGRDTQVKASVDTFALGKLMSQNKSVEVANARTVGKAIAGEILKAYNPRRA